MEILKTSFEFVDGKISDYNKIIVDEGVLALMLEVETILRPTIEQNNLSGKIVLTIFSDRANLEYFNIIPAKFALVLMEQIAISDSGEHFSKN